MQCRLRLFFWGLVGFILLASGARQSFAQLDTSTISGIVSDSTGAVIPKANIFVVSLKTGRNWKATTNSVGAFSITALPVGTYKMEVQAPGFKSNVVNGIQTHANDVFNAMINLDPGAVADTVTVTAESVSVNTTSTELGGTIQSTAVEKLPLNGRNFTDLFALIPGAVTSAGTNNAAQNSMDGFSTLTIGANILLDGTDATRVDTNSVYNNMGREDSRVTRSSIDDIQEVRVLSSNYSAEYGHAIGDVVNVITKSGGNQIHGTVFEFLRNSALDARNYFYVPGESSPLHLNQFGGNLGGPIKKDKLFYFVNYEGVRQLVTTPTFGFVLNSAMRAKAVPAVKPIVDAIPLGNAGPAASSQGVNFGYWFDIYKGTTSERVREDTGAIKLDYTANAKNNFAFRYNINDSDTTQHYGFAAGQTSEAPGTVQLGKLTWNFFNSPTFLNEAGLAVNRPFVNSYSGGGGFPLLACFFCQVGLGVVPSPQMLSIIAPATSIQAIDTATKIIGRHELRFGFDIRRNLVNRELLPQDQLTFNGGPAVAAANGSGGPEGMLANSGIGWSRTGYPMTGVWNVNYAYFINDNFRWKRNVSINLGLRYDHNSVIHDPKNKLRNFDVATLSFLPATEAFYQATWTDFAPRIGLVWDPFKNGKTAFKAGYGLFFLPVANGDVLNESVNTYPNLSINIFQQLFGGVSCTPAVTYTYPLPSQFPTCSPQAPANVYAFDRNEKDTYAEHWSVGVQQEIYKNTVLNMSYVGNHGIRISSYANLNSLNPATGQYIISPLFSNITRQGNFAGSVYNALQVNLTHTASHGLNVNANYTWSKEKDDALGLFEEYQNPYDLKHEWGTGDTDLRNNFSAGFTWDVPNARSMRWLTNGWQLTGFVVARGGFPLTIYGTQTSNYSNPVRANCVAGVSDRPSNYSAPLHQLNAAAFSQPAAGDFGTCAKNTARGPNFFSPDTGLMKNTRLSEKLTWELRGEFFNVINHPNFANPATTLGLPSFGQSATTVGNLIGVGTQRQIQISTKFAF